MSAITEFLWVYGQHNARCSTVLEVLISEFLIRSMNFLSLERYFLEISITQVGIVAEKSRFWVFLGAFFSTY